MWAFLFFFFSFPNHPKSCGTPPNLGLALMNKNISHKHLSHKREQKEKQLWLFLKIEQKHLSLEGYLSLSLILWLLDYGTCHNISGEFSLNLKFLFFSFFYFFFLFCIFCIFCIFCRCNPQHFFFQFILFFISLLFFFCHSHIKW